MTESTDRDLLQAAALAAGYKYGFDTLRDGSGRYRIRVNGVEWRPFDDDGDALRLAAQLGIDHNIVFAGGACSELIREGHAAAARRAIVLAAATRGTGRQHLHSGADPV